MADQPTIIVSVDGALHHALKEMAQNVYDQHGIMLDRVLFDWARMSSEIGRLPTHKVCNIAVETSSEHL